jgi:hypothetical protein
MENLKRKALDLVKIDFHHLVGRSGQVTYRTRTIEIGLSSRQQYLDAITGAGLDMMEYCQGIDIPMAVFVARRAIISLQ